MSLKTIHEASKQQNISENRQESKSDLELIEQQSRRITELEEQLQKETDRAAQSEKKLETANQTIQTLSSDKSKLKNKIAEQAGHIEKLHGSDLVLKENEKLTEETQNANEAAEACKTEYKQKAAWLAWEQGEAERLRKDAEAAKKKVEEERSRQDMRIERQATALYHEREKSLKEEYEKKKASYQVWVMAGWLCSLLTTVLMAARSECLIKDLVSCFSAAGRFLRLLFTTAIEGANEVSKLADKIPQEIVAIVLHYILLALVFLLIVGIAFALVAVVMYKMIKFFVNIKFADLTSLIVAIVSVAMVVCFAEPVSNVIPFNLLLVEVIIYAAYMFIRMVVSSRYERSRCRW